MKSYSGKRSHVYCIFNIAIKTKRKDTTALNRIKNEANWLNILNKYNIGPKMYFCTENLLIMKNIRGERILNFFTHATKDEKIKIIKEILRQCRILDKLKVDKYEMHHPLKHILIKNNKVIMIDFERCKYSIKPKNVTQFIQFITQLGFNINKEKLKKILQEYKKDYSARNYKKLINQLAI